MTGVIKEVQTASCGRPVMRFQQEIQWRHMVSSWPAADTGVSDREERMEDAYAVYKRERNICIQRMTTTGWTYSQEEQENNAGVLQTDMVA